MIGEPLGILPVPAVNASEGRGQGAARLSPILLVEALFNRPTIRRRTGAFSVKILDQRCARIPCIQHRRALFEVVLVLNVFVRLKSDLEHIQLEVRGVFAERAFRHRDQRGARWPHLVYGRHGRRGDLGQAQPATGSQRIDPVLGWQDHRYEQRNCDDEGDGRCLRQLPERRRRGGLHVSSCVHRGTVKYPVNWYPASTKPAVISAALVTYAWRR